MTALDYLNEIHREFCDRHSCRNHWNHCIRNEDGSYIFLCEVHYEVDQANRLSFLDWSKKYK
jgi:hypothetical protein